MPNQTLIVAPPVVAQRPGAVVGALSAGQRRALRTLSRATSRYRCPNCLDDSRYPRMRADGAQCPFCGHTAGVVEFTRQPTAAGFRWRARHR